MRSRFTAFALADLDHLLASWDPAHRPSREELASTWDPALRWTRLRILDVEGGGQEDATGIVEFAALARGPEGKVRLHERSRFRRIPLHPGWAYVDGEIAP